MSVHTLISPNVSTKVTLDVLQQENKSLDEVREIVTN